MDTFMLKILYRFFKNAFLKDLFEAPHYSIYLIKNLKSKITAFYVDICKLLFIPVIKADFSASLLQSTASHDSFRSHTNMFIFCSMTISYC